MKDMRCRWDENGGADGDKAARTWRKKLGEKNLAARTSPQDFALRNPN
jgi:hypothetical protein